MKSGIAGSTCGKAAALVACASFLHCCLCSVLRCPPLCVPPPAAARCAFVAPRRSQSSAARLARRGTSATERRQDASGHLSETAERIPLTDLALACSQIQTRTLAAASHHRITQSFDLFRSIAPPGAMRSSLLSLLLALVCATTLASAFICPDGKTVCPERSTCCVGADGFYDCCPVYYAQCCSGGSTCCPPGYQCSYDGSSCVTDLTKHPLQQTVGAPATAAPATATGAVTAPAAAAPASIPAVRRTPPAVAHE